MLNVDNQLSEIIVIRSSEICPKHGGSLVSNLKKFPLIQQNIRFDDGKAFSEVLRAEFCK